MKVIELIEKLQQLGQPNLEVVAHYPEFDYPWSIDKVELVHFRDPDNPKMDVIKLALGDD